MRGASPYHSSTGPAPPSPSVREYVAPHTLVVSFIILAHPSFLRLYPAVQGREALLAAKASEATAVLCHDKTEHIMYSCAVILNNLSALPEVHTHVRSVARVSRSLEFEVSRCRLHGLVVPHT